MNIVTALGLQNSGKTRAIAAFTRRHNQLPRSVYQAPNTPIYELPLPFSSNLPPVNVAVMNSSRQERERNADPHESAQRFVELMTRYEAAGVDCALMAFSLVDDRGLLTDLVLQPLRAFAENGHAVRVVYLRRTSLGNTGGADACFLRVCEIEGLNGGEVVDNFENRGADDVANYLERAIWSLASARSALAVSA